MAVNKPTRVGVNGYGAIGKRVADAVLRQDDMSLVGVADVATDWRPGVALDRGMRLFGSHGEQLEALERAGLEPAGGLEDLVGQVDVMVDCTPSRTGIRPSG